MASKKKTKTKKKAPKKTAKVKRACTVCRQKGHNARTCGR